MDDLNAKLHFIAELEEDWRDWLEEIFPKIVCHGFAPHHAAFWDWVWSINGGEPADPFIAVWARGHGKSTSAELACAALGAKGARSYVLYVSETQEQADKHVVDIASLLESEKFGDYYPLLQSRKLGLYGNSKGWRRNRLATADGFIVDACGLDSAARGIKFEGKRPDLIIFDDIDSKHDSIGATQRKIETITTSIIPAGADHVAVLGIQNLIHKNSIFSQMVDGRAQFLANRTVSGPVPALREMVYEKRQGKPGYNILSGIPTWDGMDLVKAQKELDDIGLDAFLRECQHEVATTPEGALFAEFNEIYHIATQSEFAVGYGRLCRNERIARSINGAFRLPYQGHIGRYIDWGTTPAHPCVVGWFWRPSKLMPLSDWLFSYRERTWPAYPEHEIPLIPVSPGRVLHDINKVEIAWNERARVIEFRGSHEASAAFNAFRQDAPKGEELVANKIKTDRKDGIAQAQNLLQIDYSKPHPFRVYPEGHYRAGEPLMGCPRFLMIVADGQGELFVDQDGKLRVKGAIDSGGFARARFEIPDYRNKIDSTGVELNSPSNKINDDWIDMFKMAVRYFGVKSAGLNELEKVEAALPESLQLETIRKQLPELQAHEKENLWIARQMEREKIKEKREKAKEPPVWRRGHEHY